jgi:hypothetical protein
MLDAAPESSTAHRVLHLAGFAILGVGVFTAINDEVLGWFVIDSLIGGALAAGVLIATSRWRHRAPTKVPDPFAQDAQRAMFNISRVHVAGFGGLGLVMVALVMALTFPQIGVSIALGLVGGFVLAMALIPYRRQHAGRWP